MKIEVTFKSDSLSPALREYAETRLANVERLGEEFRMSEIVFRAEREEFICEVILHRHRGEPFIAQERAREGRAAVDGVAAKLEKQFIRFKQKRTQKNRRPKGDE
ncbi:MAG: ribosome-associated translation inhibitor RaiA [Planctomycetes bacterium]|nr:ribosome-associated translation inhibitor RaiA [Planctomycetota bacterium]MBL7009092.1 ribosome-associated translation inhibitor RaiA [Planctomycetota bacterium]